MKHSAELLRIYSRGSQDPQYTLTGKDLQTILYASEIIDYERGYDDILISTHTIKRMFFDAYKSGMNESSGGYCIPCDDNTSKAALYAESVVKLLEK